MLKDYKTRTDHRLDKLELQVGELLRKQQSLNRSDLVDFHWGGDWPPSRFKGPWYPKSVQPPMDGSAFLAFQASRPWPNGRGAWPEEYLVLRYKEGAFYEDEAEWPTDDFDWWMAIPPPPATGGENGE